MRASTGHTTIICLSRNAALALAVNKRRARAEKWFWGGDIPMQTVFVTDDFDLVERVVIRAFGWA